MSTMTTTTALGASEIRGSSSKTRNLPARISRNARSNATLRQNSLLSIPTSAQGAPPAEAELYGFYPAITHFTDAITALPRDYRRHTSLLKEVDAKAWALEENLQKLLQQCLHERQTRPAISTANTTVGSVSSIPADLQNASAAGSVVGNVLDTASQYSNPNVEPDSMLRLRMYAELRNNLMQMIMPLDEKNHVINNANDELSRHIRRQDEIWPHIADEISEETRLGSLKHWALTDLNPTKKTQAAAARGRDAALADNEVAERSERRREAMALAKKQKTAQHAESDPDARKASRKVTTTRKTQPQPQIQVHGLEDAIANAPLTTIPSLASLSGLKPVKARTAGSRHAHEPAKKPALYSSTSTLAGPVAMSRENSHQEKEPSKKRKAPAPPATAARKRINASTQESPKLGHSPLAATFRKDVHKRSPALSHVRPVNGRGRQNSAHSADAPNRPSSAASKRNGVTATGSELERVATATGKTGNEITHTMKETVTSSGERMLMEDVHESVDHRVKGGILLERSASKSSQLKREAQETISGRRTASPRLGALDISKIEKNGKTKAKLSTPILGTFMDAETSESAAEGSYFADGSFSRLKRPVRPRMKDHHGLHDSLSPKGLPNKRTHKKNASYSLAAAVIGVRKEEDFSAVPTDQKAATSRNNSRSTKNNSTTDPSHDSRNASSTPNIGGPTAEIVEEPEALSLEQPPSGRQSQNPRMAPLEPHYNVKPPRTAASKSPILKAEEFPRLLSPDFDEDDEADEDDPNEARYCYCNGVSYGEMVACDNDDCVKEWFHLGCTGLRTLPPARTNWYCDNCKAMMA